MSHTRNPGAHVLAWLHMQGIEDRMTIAEMADYIGVRERTVVNWRSRYGFENLDTVRARRMVDVVRHAIRIDPHLSDRAIAARYGWWREAVMRARIRAGIPEYRARIRAEIREYLAIDPTLDGDTIRQGMEADGWLILSDLSSPIADVRREVAA